MKVDANSKSQAAIGLKDTIELLEELKTAIT